MPDSLSPSETELRTHIERVLSAHYELDREIGRGGMGIVYRGRDRRLKRTVAIKVLPPELGFRSEIRTRFLKEAETAAQLSHPNIVPIYSVGEQENLVFFVMSCVEGDNIAKHLHDRGPFDPDEARRILREVAEALAYAHSHGVVHRDIKPDNIIIDGESGRPLVTDFGIARAVTDSDSRLTATGIAIGTPAFMSPEQSLGEKEIDGRSDLYSLGVVGYQMLCGELPFRASNTPSMLMKHISEIPEPIDQRRADLPPDLARAVMLLLEKDPANRFPSADALAVALESGEVPEYDPPVRQQAADARAAWSDAAQAPPLTEMDVYEPSNDEVRRWNAPAVLDFRRKFAFFIPINAVIFLFAFFSETGPLLMLTLAWSVYIAYKYAGLWSSGYDWRDVFRQPRHRTLLDLTSEAIDDIGALSDAEKRRALRERSRRKLATSREYAIPRDTAHDKRPGKGDRAALARTGEARPPGVLDRAAADRDEILRIIGALPKGERARMSDIAESAKSLYYRLDALSRIRKSPAGNEGRSALATIDGEIRQLEAEANPLDAERSEHRARKLAFLKRQRRALTDVTDRADRIASQMDDCSIALHNMRLDMTRLHAGTQSHEQVTLLAERAMSLARDVDETLSAAEDTARSERSGGKKRRNGDGK